MKHIITLFTLSSLVVLAGCTTSDRTTRLDSPSEDEARQAEILNTNEIAEVAETTSNSNKVTDVAENTNSDETSTDEVDTSEWKTYTNEEYGFSFKYPEEWVIKKNNNQSSKTNSQGILSLGTGGHYPYMSVKVSKDPLNEQLQELKEFDAVLSPVILEETITINNTEAIHIVKKGIDFPTSTYFITLGDGATLVFDGVQRYDKVMNTLIVQ